MYAIVLARLEQWYRAGPVVAGHVVRPLRAFDGDIQALAGDMAARESVDDLGDVARAALEDLSDLRGGPGLQFGSEFAQSTALGGADADLIADGLLLELKCAARTRIVRRRELWQLLGYLLSDTDDAHRIHSVGFVAVRWHRRLIWDRDAFVSSLYGSPAPALEDLRREFAAVARQAHEERRAGGQPH